MNSYISFLASSFLILLIGCSANDESKKLMQGFKSHTDYQYLISNSSDSEVWKILEHTKNEDERPKYDLLVAETDIRLQERIDGRTVLTYFNNRLMEVRFYPDVQSTQVDSLTTFDSMKESEGVRCWVATDIVEKIFFACEEVVLSKEHRKWLRKYS